MTGRLALPRWCSSPAGVNVAIVLFNVLLLGVMWSIVLGLLRSEREDAIRAAIDRNDNLAIAFEQYVVRTLESADTVIRYLIWEHARSGGKVDLGKFAANFTAGNQSIVGVVLADERGDAVTSAFSGKVAALSNVADREHFSVHVGRDSGKLFVGKPVIGRASGKPMIPVTRRINTADGTFRGVAMALIEPNRFVDVLRDAKLHPLDVITLVGLDGIVRSRLRGDNVSWGDGLGKSPLFTAQPTRPVGNFFAKGQLDGMPKFFSYRTLPDYQLISLIGAAEADVLAEFHHVETRYFWAASLVSALIACFSILLMLALAAQRRAAASIECSQARFLATFNQAAVGIAHSSLDGRFLDVNQKLCDILGFTREELLARTIYQISHADDFSMIKAARENLHARSERGDFSRREKCYVRKDGALVWCDLTLTPVRDAAGEIEYFAAVILDISDRKRAEAIAQSEEMFSDAMIESMPGILYFYDENMKFLRWNRNFVGVSGYTAEEIAHMHPLDFFADEDRARVDSAINQVFDKGDAFVEADFVAKDGSTTPYLFTGKRLVFEGSVCLVGVGIDVSARKQAERLVRESEQRLVFALEAAEIGDWDMDLRTNVALRSMRHDKCFGYTGAVTKWGYDTFLAHVDTLDHDRVDAAFRNAMTGGGDYDVKFRVSWPDGSLHWLWSKGRFYFDDTGQPYRVAGIVVDITSRKQAEIVNGRMTAIVESSDDAIISKDLNDIIVTWNTGAQRIFGYSADQIIGHSTMQLIPPDRHDEETFILDRIRRGERVEHFETVRVASDGGPIDVSITESPVKDGAGNIIGASKVVRDITERKRAEEALRNRSARLQKLSRQLMSVEEQERRRLGRELHDRTGANLSALLLSFEVLRNKLPPAVAQELGSRFDDGEALLQETIAHVRDILADLRPAALDELGLLSALEHYVRLLAHRTGLEIFIVGHEPSPRLPDDCAISLFRIAQEALNNATRHAQANCINVALEQTATHVVLTIADDGKGFDVTLQQAGSTSLGLTTMRERAEAMDAQLRIDSAPGKGTRIMITVPYPTERREKEQA